MAGPDRPTDQSSDNPNLPVSPGLLADGQPGPGDNNKSRVSPEQSKTLEQKGVLPKIDENVTKLLDAEHKADGDRYKLAEEYDKLLKQASEKYKNSSGKDQEEAQKLAEYIYRHYPGASEGPKAIPALDERGIPIGDQDQKPAISPEAFGLKSTSQNQTEGSDSHVPTLPAKPESQPASTSGGFWNNLLHPFSAIKNEADKHGLEKPIE